MRWRRNTITPPAPTGETTPTPAPDLTQAVDAYAEQAQAADALAEVDTRHLDTPTANPNALATLNAERTRTARERIQLDYERERMTAEAEHARLVDRITEERRRATASDARSDRAVSEAVADADEAAAELAEVRQFERASSPVTATRRLMGAARTWRREEFAYAIAGSALSAVGISALLLSTTALTAWLAPIVAVLVETVLTVRVIRLIGQRSELAEQHKGAALDPESPGGRALVFLTRQIVALLATSILLNLVGLVAGAGALGVIGALGAAGAAVASWSAWRTSQAATATVASNIVAWQGSHWAQARQELRTRAAGAHIPHLGSAPAEAGGTEETERLRRVLSEVAEEHLAALADRGTDALAAMLNHTPPSTGEGALTTPLTTPDHPGQGELTTPQEVPKEPALEGNRLVIWQAICQHGRGVSTQGLAKITGLARNTVRTHRTALWRDGYDAFDPDTVNDH